MSSFARKISRVPTTAISSEWPNATNTGPTGTLTVDNRSSVTITTNNTIIENRNFTGTQIAVNPGVSGVIIRNCQITISGFWGVDMMGINCLIEDCRFVGTWGGVAAAVGTSGGGCIIRRCDISQTSDGLKLNVGDLAEDCYIHDLWVLGESHNDGIQFGTADSITVRHCWISSPDTSCILMGGGESRPPAQDCLIENNWLQGGGYSFYGPYGASVTPPGPSSNIQVINNKFSTAQHPNGGFYGPNTQWEDGIGNVWAGNVWADGPNAGQPVAPGYF